MKRSAQVTLTLAAIMGLAACNRRPDPCEAATFDPEACRNAVQDGGYYYHGSWVPMSYRSPYPYYYDTYSRHVSSGGSVHPAPGGSYGISRGGFGSIGSGHGVGA